MVLQMRLPEVKLPLNLICGIIIGFTLTLLLHGSSKTKCDQDALFCLEAGNHATEFTESLGNSKYVSTNTLPDENTHGYTRPSLAERLFNETRVLCWVITTPENHANRAVHVKRTWGSRCNKLIFMSTSEDVELGAVKLPVHENRRNQWQKIREAAKYVYEHHADEADWFLKADDDTYFIMENLRLFLHPLSSTAPLYFGCKFKPHVLQGYMAGSAGYVLSKEALRRFVEEAYPNPRLCRQHSWGSEDVEMGNCLQNVHVIAGDSRDAKQRGRFFPNALQTHLTSRRDSSNAWYWRYIYYNTTDGFNCCSPNPISFHYSSPNSFHVLDYLIYRLRPFDAGSSNLDLMESIPAKENASALMDIWRNDKSDNPI